MLDLLRWSLPLLMLWGTTIAAQQPQEAAPSEPTPAQPTVALRTDTIAVAGRCGHCQKRIEGALKEVEGIHSARWDRQTKLLVVTYEPERISRRQIQERIAAVGHDTEEVTAPKDAYERLPKCCRYRPE
jgi:mercuric ion binding protein